MMNIMEAYKCLDKQLNNIFYNKLLCMHVLVKWLGLLIYENQYGKIMFYYVS